jgi:hypothetical protein
MLRILNLKKKFLKRTQSGVKIFLNFFKNLFEGRKVNIVCFKKLNFFIFFLKKNLSNYFFLKNKLIYFLISVSISFSSEKIKKIKSIKKRLRKKIFLNFVNRLN